MAVGLNITITAYVNADNNKAQYLGGIGNTSLFFLQRENKFVHAEFSRTRNRSAAAAFLRVVMVEKIVAE